MEKFEDRVLLNIGPTNPQQDPVWQYTLNQAIQQAGKLEYYRPEQLAATHSWVVGLADAANPSQLAAGVGADSLGSAPVIEDSYIWQFDTGVSWQQVAAKLQGTAGVDYFFPLVPLGSQDIQRLGVPNDTLFSNQWHLLNTGANSGPGGVAGADANVTPVWNFPQGTGLGTGVQIGIVDDSLQHSHPDLSSRYRADLSWDFSNNDPDPEPVAGGEAQDNHGTSVAGVAAATGNNGLGVSGSAPGAELAGLRFLSSYGTVPQTDAMIAQALSFKTDQIDVYNNSWGYPYFFSTTSPLALAAIQAGATTGRGGLGNVYVFAAGNSDLEQADINYAALNSSRFVIPVAAIGSDGKHSYYSTRGSALLVSAYSNNQTIGITTTDRTGDDGYNAAGAGDGDPLADTNYTSQFGGTSSASPLTAGVVALILEANPTLTYRDVQNILVDTARKNDPTDPGWTVNAAGHNVNYLYGFGAIDAAAAVAAAKTWQNVGQEQRLFSGVVNVGASVPDNSQAGVSRTITMGGGVTKIEHVEVRLDLTSQQAGAAITGQLDVVLTSPQGTQSILVAEHENSPLNFPLVTGFNNWVFTTTRDWGESSAGDWTLTVRDRVAGTTGRWNSWSLAIYGEQVQTLPPDLVSIIPNQGAILENGAVLNVAPRELTLRFNEGQSIDPATLGAIRIVRSGGDGVFGAGGSIADVSVPIGWRGIGEVPNEVVVRFAENLPDDLYQIRIFGSTAAPLKNIQGVPFRDGQDLTVGFELDLGPQVIAVVPQPVRRDGQGFLTQARNEIEVYFSEAMDFRTVTDPQFYTLFALKTEADPTDDLQVLPTQVRYEAAFNKAVLVFGQDVALYGAGSFRLRIGDRYQQIDTSTIRPSADPGSSFLSAYGIGTLGVGAMAQSRVVFQSIDPQLYTIEWPGAIDEPGHRFLPPGAAASMPIENHIGGGDGGGGVPSIAYNFADVYGTDPQGNVLHNLITETQKQRTREVFELYGRYIGAQFAETLASGVTIVTGDPRALSPTVPAGPTGVGGIAGGGVAIMNSAIDWGRSEFGGGWYTVAMHEIGHLLGLGHSYDLPPGTIMGSSEAPNDPAGGAEPVFPGDNDIVHGQYTWRPDSNDVDLYQFNLDTTGTFSAETIAERQHDSSMLNSVITLYDADHEIVARNDDYFSKDSFLKVHLDPGTYYVAVTASGNTDFDPQLENTGLGGRTQGPYDLRLNFEPDRTVGILDAAVAGGNMDHTATLLDGDLDGVPGGIYDFWFKAQTSQHTLMVDKAPPKDVNQPRGSLANPYNEIDLALAAAAAGDVVRIVGNGGADGNVGTVGDNLAYEIGRGKLNNTLVDGTKMELPKGVTVMIDAGALLKLRGANVDAGSSTQNIDRSLSAIQVLGTPEHSVIFTSYFDESIGVDTEPLRTTPEAGDWGGLVFRNDLDYDEMKRDPTRRVLESAGIFLNYVNHADLRFGGGEVIVNGVSSAYAPIHLAEARPTISFNRITNSADAAISADPNSFLESKFQGETYTADYGRVGPDVHGNYLVGNSINAMFVRIRTQAGNPIDKLEVPGRFDDLDVVHVIAENLHLSNSAGGPIERVGTCPLLLTSRTTILASSGQGLADQQYFSVGDGLTTVVFEFENRNGVKPGRVPVPFTFNDSADTVAASIETAINQAVALYGLNVTVQRTGASVTVNGPQVVLDGFATLEARTHGRLAIDPGTIVKFQGSRIEGEIGSQLLAEGTVSYPIIMTSIFDDRYGAGGTFDTNHDVGTPTPPSPGDWAGLYFGPNSSGSIDFARVFYAGGNSAIEGGFGNFNPVEIRQADVRVANTLFENNDARTAGDRNGRASISRPATIHVRGAQPVIVNNVFRNNRGAVASIDVNALKSTVVGDWGRSRDTLERFDQYDDNHGPLVRLNRFTGNDVNGMIVRGGGLTTEVIWDDTDVVHVVYDEINVPNFHTYGGLRLQSSQEASLVVKLQGATAGFTATGRPLEIDDRMGGTIQIVGVASHPVILTSLADDTVGAGFDPWGHPMLNTNNVGGSPQPGDWRSIRLDRYSNDRNVAVVNELERAFGTTVDENGLPAVAQKIGLLGTTLQGGDDVLRLGFDVHGYVRYDVPDDLDVYRFDAVAGTEVWFDLIRSRYALDSIVELIDAGGSVLAWSDNTASETAEASETVAGQGLARPLQKDSWTVKNYGSTNPRDAGMRVILPGPVGETRTYYVRVRAAVRTLDAPSGGMLRDGQRFSLSDGQVSVTFEFEDKLLGNGVAAGNEKIEFTKDDSAATVARAIVDAINRSSLPPTLLNITAQLEDASVVVSGPVIRFDAGDTALTRVNPAGQYDLQIRLRQLKEVAGSVVSHAYISYATNGVEVIGQPGSSPLLGEAAETAGHGSAATAQPLGNLLTSNQEVLAVGGTLTSAAGNEVDWYRFGLDVDAIQSIAGVNDQGSRWPVTLDLDYADGMGRADTSMYLFDSAGRLIYIARDSNVIDDQPAAGQGADTDDLTRGTFGKLDPFLGTIYLPEDNGMYYNVAITSLAQAPTALTSAGYDSPTNQPLLRLEPVNSLQRVAEDHVGSQDGSNIAVPSQYPLFPGNLEVYADDFSLSDVILYVNDSGDLYTVNPFTGAMATDVTYTGLLPGVGSGRFYSDIKMRNDGRLQTVQSRSAVYAQLDTGDARNFVASTNTTIVTGEVDPNNPQQARVYSPGLETQAMEFDYTTDEPYLGEPGYRHTIIVGNARGPGFGVEFYQNLVYVLNSSGVAYQKPNTTGGPRLTSDMIPLGALDFAATGGSNQRDPFYLGSQLLFASDRRSAPTVLGKTTIDYDIFALDPAVPDVWTRLTFDTRDDRQPATSPDGTKIAFASRRTGTYDVYVMNVDGSGVTRLTTAAGDDTRPRWSPDGTKITFMSTRDGNNEVYVMNADGSGQTNLTNSTASDVDPSFSADGLQIVFASNRVTDYDIWVMNADGTNPLSVGAHVDGNDRYPCWQPNGQQIAFSTVRDVNTGNPDGGYEVWTMNFDGTGAQQRTRVVTGDNVDPVYDAFGSGIAYAGNRTGTWNVYTLSGFGGMSNPVTSDYIGDVTGLATINNQMYAVTEWGDLWKVNNLSYLVNDDPNLWSWGFTSLDPTGQPKDVVRLPNGGPQLEYVARITHYNPATGEHEPIVFSGLNAGPKNVEGGRYANMLFATDEDGRMYAFNASGEMQPVFYDGQTEIALEPGAGIRGVTFSNIDYNLWHPTTRRWSDQGHGIEPTLDASRVPPRVLGDTSFYFGLEDPRAGFPQSTQPQAGTYQDQNSSMFQTYDMPGGAFGRLTSSTFSLKGYDPTDKPTLYFNYYANTQDSRDFDGLRVFASNDGANWTLIASNTDLNSGFPGESVVGPTPIIDTAHTDGQFYWRQARVDLSSYAGLENVRLRFDVSTASDEHVGDPMLTGSPLHAVAGFYLMDGNNFEVDGTRTFEFDMGFAAVMPNVAGKTIPSYAGLLSGETLTITNAASRSVTFEFNKGPNLPSANVSISITDIDTSYDVATKLMTAVNSALGAGTAVLDATHPDRVFFPTATNVYQKGARRADGSYLPVTLTLEGNAPGTGRVAFASNRTGNNEVFVASATGTNVVDVTKKLLLDTEPAYSPDGTKIVFSAERDANGTLNRHEIYVMNVDGTGQTRLTYNSADDLTPRFSPDGNRIVFSSNRDGNYEIYSMNIDGTHLQRLTSTPQDETAPMYSPDGARIVFVGQGDGVSDPADSNLYTINVDGSGRTMLSNLIGEEIEPFWGTNGTPGTNGLVVFASNYEGFSYQIYTADPAAPAVPVRLSNNAVNDRAPVFNSTATRVAFLSDRSGGMRIFTMNADGSGVSGALSSGPTDQGPRYNPANSRLVFSSNRDDNWAIYEMPAGGGAAANLSHVLFAEVEPVFSPDGTKVAVSSSRNGDNRQLYLMNADGTGQQSITRPFLHDADVSYSPDGGRVAFASNRTGNYEIYAMNVDGSDLVQLTFSPGDDRYPVFSPDGSMIAFTSTRTGSAEIHLMNANGTFTRADGTVLGQLTTSADAKSAIQFSPDGTKIVYSGRSGTDPAELYTVSLADKSVTRLTNNAADDVQPFFIDNDNVVFASNGDPLGTNPDGDYEVFRLRLSDGSVVQLTANGADDVSPAYSAAAGKIAFTSYRDGNYETYVMNPDGSGQARLTSNAVTDVDPRFSPDGTKLAFITTYDGDSTIHVINSGGGGESNLSRRLYDDVEPAFSPDGNRLVFSSRRDGDNHNQVYVVNVDGSGLASMSTRLLNDGEFSYSPDGSQIVFAARREGQYDIYLMNADGTSQRRLTTNAADDRFPAFRPDGNRIVFTSRRDGNEEIYAMNVDGSGQTRLTFNGTDDTTPRYSPDGQSIVFSSKRDGSSEIYKMRFDGFAQTRLTNTAGRNNVEPYWGSNNQILFASNRDGNFEVYRMNADGTGQTRLTANAADDRGPAYNAAADQIVFSSVRSGNSDLFVMNADGTNQVPLTNTPLSETLPKFRPGTAQIAFDTNRGGYNAIYAMSTDGTRPTDLSEKLFNDGEPVFNADASRIAFHTNRDGNFEIYWMNAAGTTHTRLTNNAADDLEPVYNPDGSLMAFTTRRNGNAEVYVMSSSGTGQARRTIDAGEDTTPSFSPDGKKIMFTSSRNGALDVYVMNVDGTDTLRITTSAADDVQPSWGPGGVEYLSVPVTINPANTEQQVATAIWTAFNGQFTGKMMETLAGSQYADGQGFRVVNAAGTVRSFEFDTNGSVRTGNVAVPITGLMTAVQVATAITDAINGALAPAIYATQSDTTGFAKDNRVILNGTDVRFDVGSTPLTLIDVPGSMGAGSKLDVDRALVQVIGHQVTSALPAVGTVALAGLAPLGYSETLPGDHPLDKVYSPINDRFNNFVRGQNNHFEGFYVDDLIIGFAERGEMVTAATADASFTAVGAPATSILDGEYQFEVRRSQVYGNYDPAMQSPPLALTRAFSTNDRFEQAFTLLAPAAGEITHGETFQIGDGINKVTFQFRDRNLGGQSLGIPIYFTGRETSAQIAQLIVQALGLATTINVTGSAIPTSNRVDLFGAAWVDGIDFIVFGDNYAGALTGVGFPKGVVTTTYSTDANALRDAILGSGIRVIGDATLVGSGVSSGFFTDGTNSGILLTSGDARFAAGPNAAGNSSGLASQQGDADLENAFGFAPGTTRDTSSLEFSFETTGGDLFFDYVFASEEYNEWVGSTFNDAFAFLLDGQNVAVIPGTSTPVSINNVNLGRNPQYYVNNDRNAGGLFLPQIGYDGFTSILRVRALGLLPGIHTIKMVISDVSDMAWDSGVFIWAGSFSNEEQAKTHVVTSVPAARVDSNHRREQGQVVVEGNRIEHAAAYGVVVDAAARDYAAQWPHPGSPLPLREINTERLVPGIMIDNNVLAFNVGGGVSFSGDPRPAGQPAPAVPFGRIVNNTLYGNEGATARGTGILVGENASPTILNNIVANFDVGINVDPTSGSTVIGTTAYQDNGANVVGAGLGTFPLQLAATDPLFVNPAAGNFYPDRNSQVIDSSLNTLADRPAMITVRDPLGVPPSPIMAPDEDLYGQLRIDDPSVAPPPGMGANVFKDRGAIDRVDFLGPTSSLIDPQDNDASGVDRDPALNDVRLAGQVLTQFAVQLLDKNGVGIDDLTVAAGEVEVRKDGALLVEGLDYFFVYNATNDVVNLIPAAGVWMQSSSYTINLLPGIRDLANNPIQPNRPNGSTRFTVVLAGIDFGDAPDPTYPTLLGSNGARHLILPSMYLGLSMNSEPDAKQNATASGDQFDDGVVLKSGLWIGHGIDVDVIASAPGYVNAWVDYDGNGSWAGAIEKIFSAQPVVLGVNHLHFDVPAGLTARTTFARFRYSSVAVLEATGEAPDGEVEDYQVRVIEFLEDFGDAPMAGATMLPNGARHKLVDGFYLGTLIDSELDGQPNANATGDDLNNLDDEDGVVFGPVVPGQNADVTVTVSTTSVGGKSVYLNTWIDFNHDGDWDDVYTEPGGGQISEHVFDGVPLTTAGPAGNKLRFAVPTKALGTVAYLGATFSRFRVSTDSDLGSQGVSLDGSVPDGEVEDHKVLIITAPEDWGDAPDATDKAGYPTLKSHNGARAEVNFDFHLGALIDYEIDGLPTATATGDDLDQLPDEDGVWTTGGARGLPNLVPGRQYSIVVKASQPGILNAWIDFDGNTSWAEPTDHVFTDQPLVAGDNLLTFTVPDRLDARTTFARFRLSTVGGVSFDGPLPAASPAGEVEDYQVKIVVGDAKISGYKFEDRNANGSWDKSYSTLLPPIQLLPPGQVALSAADDASARFDLGFNFRFYGRSYSQFWVNNNGNVTFGAGQPAMAGIGFPQSLPMLAPFWSDVDTRLSGGEVRLAQGTSLRGNPVVQVDWVNVGYFSQHGDKRNTFSLYVEDDPAGDIVAFLYNGMQWTTGDRTGTGGFGGAGAQIGLDAGNGRDYAGLARPKSQAELSALSKTHQYAFRLDPQTGMPGGAEPGLAGVQVYLDLDNDGTVDAGEPVTATSADDIATPNVNELGYYEFPRLFPGTYVVREIVPDDPARPGPDWLQTNPSEAGSIFAVPGTDLADGQVFRLSDGTTTVVFEFDDLALNNGLADPSHQAVPFRGTDLAKDVAKSIADAINAASSPAMPLAAAVVGDTAVVGGVGVTFDRGTALKLANLPSAYSVVLQSKQDVQSVNFGNYALAHVSISDVKVVERNQGTTQVQVNVHFADSFGGRVTLDYVTADGPAGANGATVADNDYRPASGTFQYVPRSAPQATWDLKGLTRNLTNDYNYSVWGSRVVWQGNSGADWDIYLYDESTGLTRQLSRSSTKNRFATIYDSYVAWSGKANDGDDDEIFLYNVATGATTRLTTNNDADEAPQVSDRYVTWWAQVGSRKQVFVYDLVVGGAPVRVSDPAFDSSDPRVAGPYVVFNGTDGSDYETFLYDGTQTRRLTANQAEDRNPQVGLSPAGGANVVWESFDGADNEIYLYQTSTGTTTRITDNTEDDVNAQISGDNLVWQAISGGNSEIMYYDVSTGSPATAISGGAFLHETPQIAGTRVVWHAYDGNDWEVYYRDIGNQQTPQNVSNNGVFDGGPLVSDSLVVWRSFVDGTYQVVRAVQKAPEVVESITLVVNGDVKVESDEDFFLRLTDSRLARIDRSVATIRILNDDGSMDFGDAPDPTYPTLLASDGARHLVVSGVRLGALIDTEANGASSPFATGDDAAGQDDEDGVTFDIPLMRDNLALITVNASVDGMLDAWIDFNADGDWSDSQEQVFLSQPLDVGDNLLTFAVPRTAAVGTTLARFRFSTAGGLAPTGFAANGEVEDYAVSIANNVQLDNRRVVAYGSDLNDIYKFWAGSIYVIELNGMVHKFAAANVDSFYFDAGGEITRDLAFLYGAPGNETADLVPDGGSLVGTKYRVDVVDVESTTAVGGGGDDDATLRDSAGTDTFTAEPTSATMSGPGFTLQVSGFKTIVGKSGTGGTDTARLYDGSGDDTFTATPLSATLSGSTFSLKADNFRFVHANTSWDPTRSGGMDTARLYDSAGNDTFTATPTSATMLGTGFYVKANQFEVQEGYSTAGIDIAKLYDSAMDEVFTATPTRATMTGLGRFSSQANNFRYVAAYASTGQDTAKLYDSADVDTFVGTPTYATMSGSAYMVRAGGFDAVDAYSLSGGADVAKFYDSAKNDVFVALPAYAQLYAADNSYSNKANGFRFAQAYSTTGGVDVAYFYDSTGFDTFEAKPTYGAMYGANYYNRANYFDAVEAISQNGGNDLAKLYDSAGNDTLVATPDYVALVGPGFSLRANSFRYTNAYSSAGGTDVADLYDSAGNDTFTFSVGSSGQFNGTFAGATFSNRVNDFDQIRAHASLGYDEARLFDSALNDLLEAGGALGSDTAKLSNVDLGFAATVSKFDKVTAVSSNVGDKKKVILPLDFILDAQGPWTDI